MAEEYGLAGDAAQSAADATNNASDSAGEGSQNFAEMASAVRNGEMSLEDYIAELEAANYSEEEIEQATAEFADSMGDLGDAAD